MMGNTYYLYFLIALIELCSEAFGLEIIRYITKPLLMPALVLVYSQKANKELQNNHKMMMAALIFSWVGDTVLMFTYISENFFLIGLVSFLITHVLYTITFSAQVRGNLVRSLKRGLPMIGILGIYLAILLSILIPSISGNVKTSPFLIPVLIYTAAISIMVVVAITRKGHVNDKSYLIVLTGAVLFMLSDSLIAINKFVSPLSYASLAIMALYIAGQYLIVSGYLIVGDKEQIKV